MEAEPNTIEAQANRWVIRMDAGPLNAYEQAQLDAWIDSDARHRGALLRAQAIWSTADQYAALKSAGAARSGLRLPDAPDEFVASRRRAFARAMAIAVAAVVVIGLAPMLGVRFPEFFSDGQTYASEIGEVRKIGLVDGSQLTLNTDTQAVVRFHEAARDIALEKGEALFSVAHDSSRPFVVHANGVQVRAIGTVFTVRIDDARVDVLVTEGVVEVSRAGADVQRISANQRAVIASPASRLDVERIDADAVKRQLAWRDGMVAFSGEPLGTAVAEINRHSRERLQVDDPVLAARPVVGIFNANDAEAFAQAAAVAFGAEITRQEGTIHLRSTGRP